MDQQQQQHSCEICGKTGLSEQSLIEHTKNHVESSDNLCPFCGLTDPLAENLLVHVNQAHLDYLTPDSEMMMSFIDEQSSSVDSDSESSRAWPMPNTAHGSSSTSSTTYYGNGKLGNGMTNSNDTNSHHMNPPKINYPTDSSVLTAATATKHLNGGTTNNFCDNTNGTTTTTSSNRINYCNGGQGSPLRSQLELNLKTNKPLNVTKPSPLQCPMCEYLSESAHVLEEHINRAHFDPLSPGVQNNEGAASSYQNGHKADTLNALQCPICPRTFTNTSDIELHINFEHRDILSPGKPDFKGSICPVCGISLEKMKPQEMELHCEKHFAKSPSGLEAALGPQEKKAQKLREQREFEMLRAQYGMDDQGNFRQQSSSSMQRAVYAGEMSVADYYERQVGLRAAEQHGVDDGLSCTKSVAARVLSLSATSQGVLKTFVCSGVDHYASSYGDKGWGCGYRNLQMLLSSMMQNPSYKEALHAALGSHSMPSISRLQRLVEAAWAQGFDVQGSEQLGFKLYNTRKWIGATEVVTILSWLRINCQLVDFHKPTSYDGKHPELFEWVLRYFEEPKMHTPPLYLQHQGHSRTIIGIEQRATGLTLLVLDPSHATKQVAALGSSHDTLRLIRRPQSAMKAPQYQIVRVDGLIETEEQYQAKKVLKSLRIPPDR